MNEFNLFIIKYFKRIFPVTNSQPVIIVLIQLSAVLTFFSSTTNSANLNKT